MAVFPSTRWSLIQASGRPSGEIAAAWSELVRDYRPAIVGFFRRGGLAHEADDLAQDFLLRSMSESWWSRADAGVGSFRRFLFVLLNRFLAQQKQLGRHRFEIANGNIREGEHYDTPEKQFDLDFALCVTQHALDELRASYERDARGELFETLQAWLTETPAHGELAALGKSLGVSANTLAVQLKRLRIRFRKTVRTALTQLSAHSDDVDNDVAALRSALTDGVGQ
jgi:DNA-directed RNA polymerase specialized sigma24 family protein